MEIIETLRRRSLERAVSTTDETSPATVKVRVFGSPVSAQERLAQVIDTLRAKNYGFERVAQVAHSQFFTISDAHFRRSSQDAAPDTR